MRRCRTAAATHNRSSLFNQFFSDCRKFLRRRVINRHSVHQLRQTGIWLRKNRDICISNHFLYRSKHFLRPCGTVQSDRIRAKALHNDHCSCRVCSVKRSSVLIERQAHHHRQITGLPDRKHCCTRLLKTHHCFHHKQIHACL